MDINQMSRIAIIQARMSSRRLPGKVMIEINGKIVIEHIIDRLNKCAKLDSIVVATSTEASDDPIESWCEKNKIKLFRGSLNDVLDRLYKAGKKYNAESIIRITGDCPLIDYKIIDEIIELYEGGSYDYCGLDGEFPDGLDCTIYNMKAIEIAWKEAKLKSEREHVGPYIEKNPERFKGFRYRKFKGYTKYRWTLDEPEDLILIRKIYDKLKNDNLFTSDKIFELMKREPELMEINSDIIRNEGYLKSVKEDQ